MQKRMVHNGPRYSTYFTCFFLCCLFVCSVPNTHAWNMFCWLIGCLILVFYSKRTICLLYHRLTQATFSAGAWKWPNGLHDQDVAKQHNTDIQTCQTKPNGKVERTNRTGSGAAPQEKINCFAGKKMATKCCQLNYISMFLPLWMLRWTP